MKANNTVAIILGGGRGTRLYPLVKERSKPAVPIGGQYRMIDIPMSNCINSGVRNIYVLTQFNSASLNNHIYNAYQFDPFSNGHISILAAEQTDTNLDWYQGTADAVRKNMIHFDDDEVEYIIILSGDQVYRMNYMDMGEFMKEKDADIVVGTVPVYREDAKGFGVMHVDNSAKITKFSEKPKEDCALDFLKLTDEQKKYLNIKDKDKEYLGSMGIYIFKKQILFDLFEDTSMLDFGEDIIPFAIKEYKVYSYVFHGFWEDVGTIKAYFETNLAFASINPPFDFHDVDAPIYTNNRYLSGSKIGNANIKETLIANGCSIKNASINQAIIGVRSAIREDACLERVIMMGSDYYDSLEIVEKNKVKNVPPLGIGKNCNLKNVIIDKNVRIGDDVTITNKDGIEKIDSELYCIRDGIVIIPKKTIVPSGTII